MRPEDLVRKVILAEMVTLYRAPSQVQNAEQGAIYQTAIIQSLAGFQPDEQELRRMWEKFKRRWTKTTWPTPGDLCAALSTERRWEAPQPKALEPVDHTMTAAEEADYQNCLRRLRANPDQFFAGDKLLRMAEHFEQR